MTPSQVYEPTHSMLLRAVAYLADDPNTLAARDILLTCSRAVLTQWEAAFKRWREVQP